MMNHTLQTLAIAEDRAEHDVELLGRILARWLANQGIAEVNEEREPMPESGCPQAEIALV